MSANPTRLDFRATTPDSNSPLQQGNRVLESIAREEALRALLAFSDLHEQIRERRLATGRVPDHDLFETERFILDEVLQLICDRALAITHADGIMVALAEGPDWVCRAASGELAVARGARLNGESEFLQDCLESGNILRCDACEIDARVELDIAPKIGARSTVIVPLRGRRDQLGVLQAFSETARAFTDHDVRCFDLFAELVLSALKPEDQDRRIGWLSGVADEVLQVKPSDLQIRGRGLPPSASTRDSVELPPSYLTDETLHSHEMDESTLAQQPYVPPPLSFPEDRRPGLRVVLILAAVAALFSAATWWGTQDGAYARSKAAIEKFAGLKTSTTVAAAAKKTQAAPAAKLPSTISEIEFSDDLMDGSKTAPDASSTATDENKGTSKITGVRHWSSSVGSTVVIDMDDQVPYEVHRLASPERIYFDLHGTILSPDLEGKTLDVGDPSLTRVRIGQPVAGVTRVVLDTKDGANFSVSMETSPYRLVVELRGSEKASSAKRLEPAESVPNSTLASAAAISAPAPMKAVPSGTAFPQKLVDQPLLARSGKFRIVLDAGHGGWDLGTVGRQGLLEKDLVLDVTQRLGKLLQARLGSEVLFTRTDDNYLPLDQRADIANQEQADLFVSVHANYSTSAAARGVETYYSNMFSSPGLKEVEKHEDGTFTQLTPVSLSAEGLHEKIEQSRRLAANVQRSLYATLASSSPEIRNRGIKDAAFVVLTGTTMPAILTEISFVSSPADERNLQSAAYRQQIAEALYQGIAHYQQSSPHVRVAQLQTSSANR
jgi:N-acetylmuramoyl-L-alanine amidase